MSALPVSLKSVSIPRANKNPHRRARADARKSGEYRVLGSSDNPRKSCPTQAFFCVGSDLLRVRLPFGGIMTSKDL